MYNKVFLWSALTNKRSSEAVYYVPRLKVATRAALMLKRRPDLAQQCVIIEATLLKKLRKTPSLCDGF